MSTTARERRKAARAHLQRQKSTAHGGDDFLDLRRMVKALSKRSIRGEIRITTQGTILLTVRRNGLRVDRTVDLEGDRPLRDRLWQAFFDLDAELVEQKS